MYLLGTCVWVTTCKAPEHWYELYMLGQQVNTGSTEAFTWLQSLMSRNHYERIKFHSLVWGQREESGIFEWQMSMSPKRTEQNEGGRQACRSLGSRTDWVERKFSPITKPRSQSQKKSLESGNGETNEVPTTKPGLLWLHWRLENPVALLHSKNFPKIRSKD